MPFTPAGCLPATLRRRSTSSSQEYGCGRDARTFARHSLDRLRRWDGTAAEPCLSFGLANAVHAGRVAACRQRRAVAPPPPARNKVAGGTPAFPGGAVGPIGPCHCRSRRRGACLQPCAGVPSPPARNKVAGETPAFPGGAPWVSLGLAVAGHAGGMPAGNVVPPLHHLQPGIWLRAGRPRSRAGRHGSLWALPLQFTPAGWLPAGNLAPPLHHLQPGIRLRAGRPRSRGGAVGLPGPCHCRSRRQGACRPATSRCRPTTSSQE